jgi:hypothetical protein
VAGSQWLGNVTEFSQYRLLFEWAARCVDAGNLLEAIESNLGVESD